MIDAAGDAGTHGGESALTPSFVTGLARGAAIAFILQVIGAGFGYLSQVALARWMRITEFGIFTYLIAWSSLLAFVAGLGFPVSVLRFVPQYRATGDYSRLRGFIKMSRGATVAGGVLTAMVAVFVMSAVAPAGAGGTVVVFAVVLIPLRALVNLDSAIMRAGGGVIRAYAPSLVVRPFALVFASTIVWLAWGRLTAVEGILINLGVLLFVALLQSRLMREGDRPARPVTVAIYDPRTWLRVSMPLLLVGGFVIVLNQADLLIVGTIGGPRSAALYSVASNTATLVGYVLVAVGLITSPMFSELATKKDLAGLQRLATSAAQWVFWPTLVLAAGLGFLGPYVLHTFGAAFVTARWALVILLVGQLVSAACGAAGWILSMTGHQDDLARVYGVAAVFNVGACYLGARYDGLAGAASGTTISMIAWNLWLVNLTKRRIGVRTSILSSVARSGNARGGDNSASLVAGETNNGY